MARLTAAAAAVRQRDHHRRIDPQIRLHLPHAFEKAGELAEDFFDVAAAGEAGRARGHGIEPQHAVAAGQLHHDVVVARGVLEPIAGKTDDVLPHHLAGGG